MPKSNSANEYPIYLDKLLIISGRFPLKLILDRASVSANNLHFEVILELHPLIDSLIGPMFPTSKNIKNSGSMPWILFQPRFSSCFEYLGHPDKLLNITVSSSLNLLPEKVKTKNPHLLRTKFEYILFLSTLK